jgi:ligand-binding sensor domain-containing protein/anti-sigma regulatory factor (Ser/Thr protein kinase)
MRMFIRAVDRCSAPRLLQRAAALLFLLALPHQADALDPARELSQYIHRIWQVQQGLPQASIEAIVQTRDGYLWLGTQTGLVKFDGVRFTTVETPGGVSLTNVWISHLVEDRQGALWIGTKEAGLFKLHNGIVRRYSRDDGLPSDSVQCLFTDGLDQVWACTPDGLARITPDAVRSFGPADGLPASDVRAACAGRDGALVAGADNGRIATWKSDRFVAAALPLADPASVQAMLCAANGALWIGTSDGLLHVHDGASDRLTVANGLADDSVLTLTESRNGDVLAGTKNGFKPQDGLSQSTVYSLYEDREGTLWVATKHGLNQFLDGLTIPYTSSEGLPTNNTGPVLHDRNGTVWVGTLDGGLARFDGHRFATLTTRDGLAANAIYALAEDRGGDIWVGTAAGLNRLRRGRVIGTWTTRQNLPGNAVRVLYRDRHDTLWIATSGGPALFRDGTLQRLPDRRHRPTEPILTFGEDRTGRMYVAPDRDSPLLHRADAVYEDGDGLLWIGTLGEGLRLVDGGRSFSFSVRDGLFDDVIYGIAADDHGRLWMACSKGIFSVNRDDLRQFAAGTISAIVSTPYSPLDALRTIECQPGVQPVVSRAQDGRLWFSTVRGLLVIDPRQLTRHFMPPAVAVEDITVNGERQPPGAIGALPAGRNNVEFGYTAVSFVSPARITFRYQLQGFDKSWVDAGSRRQAFYTNLPPGRFRFVVSACNPDDACSEVAHPVSFSIEPRYYQRGWFVPLCAVGLGLAGWPGYRLRIRRLKTRFDLILAERGRIARELHDTLLQGFAGITMGMQALASRLPSSDTRRTLEDIVADAGRSLRDARRSLAGLRSHPEPQSGLGAALAQAARQLTEAQDLRLKLNLHDERDDLPADVAYNLLRIAQEAIANAVRHSGARTLQVTLDSTRSHLRLSVHDDGAGFDEDGAPPPGHYGLIGMKERAAQIGAQFKLTSEQGRGTSVLVLLES